MRTVFGYVGIVAFALLLLATTLSVVAGSHDTCAAPNVWSNVLTLFIMALGLAVSVLLVRKPKS